MEDQARQFEWGEYGFTRVHPTALILLGVCVAVLLCASRKSVLVPFLVVAVFVTSHQRIAIGAFDFTMMRLLLISGGLRAVLRADTHAFEWRKIDTLVIAFGLVSSIAYVALWRNTAAVVNRLGYLFDFLLIYFLTRSYISSRDQMLVFIRALAVICVLSALFMMLEHLANYNIFSIFGGVRPVVWIREGRLRAQGSFPHSILAGTFGAAFLPLFWGLWAAGDRADRAVAVVGAAGAIIMVLASSSSGPVLTLLGSVFAVFVWRFRSYTPLMKRATVLGLIALHMVMQAPVWHLISRVDIVGGSTGYHRFALIDNAIRRFSEWALIGVRGTRHWGFLMHDVTNQFIGVGVNGGAVSLLLFILLIGSGFRIVGSCKMFAPADERTAKLWWAWGAVLFAHCVSFFGVSYFGQMTYLWYMTLGIVAALPETRSSVSAARRPGFSFAGNFSADTVAGAESS